MTLQELAPYITAIAGVFCFVSAAKKKDILGLIIGIGLFLSAAIRLMFSPGPITSALSTAIMIGLLALIMLKFRAARKRFKQAAKQPG